MKTFFKRIITITLFVVLFASFASSQSFAEETVEKKSVNKVESSSGLKQLDMTIPDITDNPSFILTFKDPSEKKEGVHLKINGKDSEVITSPYTLPALSIGKHVLAFKFVDEYGLTQTFEEEIIIIPRAPILNTPIKNVDDITISGSALAGSEVVLIISSNQKMFTRIAEVDKDGLWSVQIVEEMPEDVYSFSAFTRKYGYASNLAEALTLDLTGVKPVVSENSKEKIHFAFKDITKNNINEVFSGNVDLLVLVGSLFLIGLLLGFLFSSLIKKRKENKVINEVSKTLEKPVVGEEKPLTLLEKLKDKTVNIENPVEEEKEPKEKPVKKNEKENKGEKIVTKIDFLKNYQEHDPDDDRGKEKKK